MLAYLEATVQGPGDGDAFGGLAGGLERLLELLEGALGLLELLDEGVDGLLGPLFLLVALLPAQQLLDRRRGEREERVEAAHLDLGRILVAPKNNTTRSTRVWDSFTLCLFAAEFGA